MRKLVICHLYPELLNLYGDRGNIIALQKRAAWRNIQVEIKHISINDKFDVSKYDIIFLGGGQDYEQEILQKDLLEQKASEIKNGIENNKTFLAICGGYQMLGKYYINQKGKEIKYLNALDFYTASSKNRMIGNILCNRLDSNTPIVGFENHSGKTFLGPNVKPLGKVLNGYGNNGEDGYEGAVYKNTFCSYLHGALLPKNPSLTDELITRALSIKYSEKISLKPLNDDFEKNAFDSIADRLR